MISAFEQAKSMFANQLDKLTKTRVNSQKPGGLISPVPQQEGKVYNTQKPLISKLKNKLRPVSQRMGPVQQAPKEQWWDSTTNARYKHFNNPEEYEAAKKWLNEAQGVQPTPSSSPNPMPVKKPQSKVLGMTVKNPRAKFVGKKGKPNIDPEVQAFLEGTVFPITREAGIPDAVAAGQFAAEGRFTGLGANRNNFYNINAVDHNPDLAFGYESPEAGVRAYADLISRRYGDALNQEDPAQALKIIEQLGYAGDPATYGQRSDSGYTSYSDFIQNVPEYRYYTQ